MSRSTDTYKENIIEYIVTNNPKIKSEGLREMDIESLVLIKLQIEFEEARKSKNEKL